MSSPYVPTSKFKPSTNSTYKPPNTTVDKSKTSRPPTKKPFTSSKPAHTKALGEEVS